MPCSHHDSEWKTVGRYYEVRDETGTKDVRYVPEDDFDSVEMTFDEDGRPTEVTIDGETFFDGPPTEFAWLKIRNHVYDVCPDCAYTRQVNP
ncbi:hypothetical protein EXE43_23885 [Halorubrum sp. SS5]|uniref:hypothetical protein n=1 Tax=unclassified Halorubrum TaxID=2642239 RepID=UPI0010F7FF8B|nr:MULTISPECIES: hypothetical protein [unclassified Halorubrum]TKX52736.1 hypothetical protein EXE42_15555 [Halorubrum sp. SP3]TKX58880.1 hypothetical protein EXE44_04875 [Halorubrum sp. SS7]TKX64057.1 hypothetical protein EXE45_16695 [Halorubrum sp. SP9]TKX83509.1 hypothetical protein EXE43_23885 [Halorubrum sp. SS5]